MPYLFGLVLYAESCTMHGIQARFVALARSDDLAAIQGMICGPMNARMLFQRTTENVLEHGAAVTTKERTLHIRKQVPAIADTFALAPENDEGSGSGPDADNARSEGEAGGKATRRGRGAGKQLPQYAGLHTFLQRCEPYGSQLCTVRANMLLCDPTLFQLLEVEPDGPDAYRVLSDIPLDVIGRPAGPWDMTPARMCAVVRYLVHCRMFVEMGLACSKAPSRSHRRVHRAFFVDMGLPTDEATKLYRAASIRRPGDVDEPVRFATLALMDPANMYAMALQHMYAWTVYDGPRSVRERTSLLDQARSVWYDRALVVQTRHAANGVSATEAAERINKTWSALCTTLEEATTMCGNEPCMMLRSVPDNTRLTMATINEIRARAIERGDVWPVVMFPTSVHAAACAMTTGDVVIGKTPCPFVQLANAGEGARGRRYVMLVVTYVAHWDLVELYDLLVALSTRFEPHILALFASSNDTAAMITHGRHGLATPCRVPSSVSWHALSAAMDAGTKLEAIPETPQFLFVDREVGLGQALENPRHTLVIAVDKESEARVSWAIRPCQITVGSWVRHKPTQRVFRVAAFGVYEQHGKLVRSQVPAPGVHGVPFAPLRNYLISDDTSSPIVVPITECDHILVLNMEHAEQAVAVSVTRVLVYGTEQSAEAAVRKAVRLAITVARECIEVAR